VRNGSCADEAKPASPAEGISYSTGSAAASAIHTISPDVSTATGGVGADPTRASLRWPGPTTTDPWALKNSTVPSTTVTTAVASVGVSNVNTVPRAAAVAADERTRVRPPFSTTIRDNAPTRSITADASGVSGRLITKRVGARAECLASSL
jgi:hypothetical protein